MPEFPHTLTYRQVLDKYNWAVKHIDNLKTALLQLRDENPIATFSKTNTDTGDVTYYVRHIPSIPSSVPLIAGDALYSLRASLDYLANGLAEVVDADTKFPIGFSAETYKPLSRRLIPGMGEDAFKVLDGIKPYQGGNLLLWLLHRLNIVDKHRLLLTVCVKNPASRRKPNQMMPEDGGLPHISFTTPDGVYGILQESRIPPVTLNDGVKFLTIPAAEAQDEIGFYFAVCLNEPGLAEGMPLDFLCFLLQQEVRNTIVKLAPYLKR